MHLMHMLVNTRTDMLHLLSYHTACLPCAHYSLCHRSLSIEQFKPKSNSTLYTAA